MFRIDPGTILALETSMTKTPLKKLLANRRYESSEKGLRTARRHNRIAWTRLRMKVFEALGGPICAHCGFTDIRALQFDHKQAIGGVKKRRLGVHKVLKEMLKHPELHQVLCANCNWIKRAENNETSKRKEV